MASVANPSLAHRSVATIRTSFTGSGGTGSGAGGTGGGGGSGAAGPTTPGGAITSPYRNTPSTFASPSALRAEEDTIVIEVGSRRLTVGFAGDATSRGSMVFGPEQQRRVGDLRVWQDGYRRDWRGAAAADGSSSCWDGAYELWKLDVRQIDAGLIADKLERALREALTRYLMIDSRPRRMVVVLPSGLPIPLVSATIDTLFGRFLAPSVALLSAPVAAAVAAGLRCALVIDLGWAETTVTSVYEYREVACTRTVRAGRMLVRQVHDLLAEMLGQRPADDTAETSTKTYAVSFEECEDVTARLVWCRPGRPAPRLTKRDSRSTEGSNNLPTVTETDEAAVEDVSTGHTRDLSAKTTEIPLHSCTPPTTVRLTMDQLAGPCEATFLGATSTLSTATEPVLPVSWDDEELPVPLLVHRHLQRLPVDVRAACMARLLFIGGGTGVLGLRGRIFNEVARLVVEQGWDGVRGRGVGQFRENPKLRRKRPGQQTPQAPQADVSPTSEVWHDAANAVPEHDPVEAEMRKARARNGEDAAAAASAVSAGELRAVETLGPWSGASLLGQLRVPALATVDREQWAQQGGAAGAARPSDVDVKTLQRQSIVGGVSTSGSGSGAGAGGSGMRSVSGAATSGNVGSGASNWTLGSWGVL